MKRLVLTVLGMLMAAGIMLSSVNAAPVSGDVKGLSGAGTLVQQIHGCHRHCAPGPGGHLHRHVGPYCERVSCGGGYYRAPRCVKDYHCEKTGPLGLKKRCYWRELCN